MKRARQILRIAEVPEKSLVSYEVEAAIEIGWKEYGLSLSYFERY